MAANHLRSALQEKRFICSAELVLGRDHTVPQTEDFVRDASKEPDGIKVAHVYGPQGKVVIVPDGTGNVIMVWEDYSLSSDYNIYAQWCSCGSLDPVCVK